MEPSSIERRRPVIGPEQAEIFPDSAVEKQWRLVTEVIRRACLEQPSMRQKLMEICNTPVSETLPLQVLRELSMIDPRVAQLCERYGQDQLSGYLALPPIPDDQLVPDISSAPELHDPVSFLEDLKNEYLDEDEAYAKLASELVEDGYFTKGVTVEERLLVARRYRFARDLKILALGAELTQVGLVKENDSNVIELPSGISITLDTHTNEQRQDLLQPHLWEKRRQLKDRVHEIVVNKRSYILKERKTNRHSDTKMGGHRDGSTSAQELATAQHFQALGAIERDRVKVRWERPVGCATYPDGFSFAVFEYEPGLVSNDQIITQLAAAIEGFRAEFEEEYQAVCVLAHKDEGSPELTFKEFARIKAFRLCDQARTTMSMITATEGYGNSDLDGYAYRILQQQPKLQLEIIGFDFEYYAKLTSAQARFRLERYSDDAERELKYVRKKGGLCFSTWDNGEAVTRMESAGFLAMLELEAQAAIDQAAQ